MNIDITTDDTDTDLLDAFCLSTGYTKDFGSQEDWLSDQINTFVTQNVRSGLVRQNSSDALAVYQTALIEAADQASQKMQQVTIGQTVGGEVISPPIKVPPIT